MERHFMKKIAALVGIIAVVGFASGAQATDLDPRYQAYKPTSGVSGSLKSIGSDTLNNVMTLWAEDFRKAYPSVQIEIEGKGSSTAPPALIAGTSQFGPMSRPMKAAEADAFEAKFGYKPTAVRVAVDTLAVFVNKDNPLQCLSLTQLDAVFSKTLISGAPASIVTWGQLGLTGEFADKPISLFGRNSASGTYGYFKDVALSGGDYKDTVKEQPGSSAVVQGIAADKYAMGYSGIGYKTADVRAIGVAGRDGKCVEPTQASAYAGTYPVTRFIYMYLNKNPSEALSPLQTEFLKFVLSRDGQADVAKDGYFPMPFIFAGEDLSLVGAN